MSGDGRAALAALQQRVARLNAAQLAAGQRLILLLEGWAGAGKKDALRQLVGALDPCHTVVHSAELPEFGEDDRHWLAPYWTRLPHAGQSILFYRGWYHRPVTARAAGALGDKEWARAGDEINEFEAQQTDHGTLVVKLFFHVSAGVRAQRLGRRPGSDFSEPPRDQLRAAWEKMFAETDTRWAPWRIIDAGDGQAAQVAALSALADALHKTLPAAAPASSPAIFAFEEERYA